MHMKAYTLYDMETITLQEERRQAIAQKYGVQLEIWDARFVSSRDSLNNAMLTRRASTPNLSARKSWSPGLYV